MVIHCGVHNNNQRTFFSLQALVLNLSIIQAPLALVNDVLSLGGQALPLGQRLVPRQIEVVVRASGSVMIVERGCFTRTTTAKATSSGAEVLVLVAVAKGHPALEVEIG